MNYQLRTSSTLNFPKVTGSRHGLYSYEFHASQLWNQVPDSTKSIHLAKTSKLKCSKVGKSLNAHAVCTKKQKDTIKILQ